MSAQRVEIRCPTTGEWAPTKIIVRQGARFSANNDSMRCPRCGEMHTYSYPSENARLAPIQEHT